MAKGKEIWICPRCKMQVDIAPLGLYAEVTCPRCFYADRVHAQLGNFRLDGVLGVGGMSVVYRAMDMALHRPLALKVLNDTFRDQPERIERFENESAMMARVRHENVTSVYSAGRAYGQFYIAMELVEGQNLERMVSPHHPLDPLYALEIISQVAGGLKAAQEAGLLHRDMKPGNVLITPSGKVKVIDFGLALDNREGDTEEIIWATPYYVPPETLKREPEDIRTDIYALGMTLRYLLTGIEKFDGPSDTLNDLVETKKNRPPFSEIRPNTDVQLCDLVDHMTEFSPSKRPANYDDLLEEINEVRTRLTALRKTRRKTKVRELLPLRWMVPLVVSVILGLGLALFVSSRYNAIQRHATLPLEIPSLMGPDEKTLQDSLRLLQEEDYDEAARMLLELAERTEESGMGAWASLLARELARCSALADADVWRKAQTLLNKNLALKEQAVPAARSLMGQIEQAASLQFPGARSWLQHSGVWNDLTENELIETINGLTQGKHPAPLALMLWYNAALQAVWIESDSLLDICREGIKRTIPELGEYSGLAPLYENLENQVEVRRNALVLADLNNLQNTVKTKGIDQTIILSFEKIANNEALPARIRSLASVRKDAATLAMHMAGMLCRRAPEKCKPGMSLEQMLRSINTPEERGKANISASILEDMQAVVNLFARSSSNALLRRLYLKQPFSQYSPDFLTITEGWQQRLKEAAQKPSPHAESLNSTAPNSLKKLILSCKEARLVTVLPGAALSFMDSPAGFTEGKQTVLTGAQAWFFRDCGVVKIERQRLVPVLGLQEERFMNFTLLPGVIQPVPAHMAKHFSDKGTGRELRSAADLEGYEDFISEKPASFLLTRTPQVGL